MGNGTAGGRGLLCSSSLQNEAALELADEVAAPGPPKRDGRGTGLSLPVVRSCSHSTTYSPEGKCETCGKE